MVLFECLENIVEDSAKAKIYEELEVAVKAASDSLHELPDVDEPFETDFEREVLSFPDYDIDISYGNAELKSYYERVMDGEFESDGMTYSTQMEINAELVEVAREVNEKAREKSNQGQQYFVLDAREKEAKDSVLVLGGFWMWCAMYDGLVFN